MLRAFCLAFALALQLIKGATNSCVSNYDFTTWSYLPCEWSVGNADPTARVFNNRLYVYTSWDDSASCDSTWTGRKQGYQQFCMPGYRAYSTSDVTLRSGWLAHGAVLREEAAPWVHRGDEGYDGAARMWAPDVVRGDDGRYYLFFPAPRASGSMHDVAVGVAVSDTPVGPFVPREEPIAGPGAVGIDPSVVRLRNGQWALFVSSGDIFVSEIDPDFRRTGERKKVQGLRDGYKEGPHVELRGDKLMMFYALSIPGSYSMEQAAANDAEKPELGFWHVGTAIARFDGRTNHGSTVRFNGFDWVFYHHHTEQGGSRWAHRRVVFSPAHVDESGKQATIDPYFGKDGFNVTLPTVIESTQVMLNHGDYSHGSVWNGQDDLLASNIQCGLTP